MSANERTRVGTLAAHLEELWSHFDTLYDSLQPADWSRPHGKAWTFADQPYHMAYCDRDAVARAVELGERLPAEEQMLCSNFSQVNAWNAQKFAARPPNQTVEQTLAQMRDAREMVRRLLSQMSDADLERKTFLFFFRGWGPASGNLAWCRTHTWNELMQFRIRLNRQTPTASAAVSHAAIEDDLNVFSIVMNREVAAKLRFTTVMEFVETAIGPFTLSVNDGTLTVGAGRAAPPDLVLTQDTETFVKTLTGIHNPLLAMLTGKTKVRGWRNVGTFGKLFALK